MKKILIVAILYLLPVNNLLAQEYWQYGVKGGVSLSNLNMEQHISSGRTGYYLGAFAEIPLSGRFSLQPEILYSTQGAGTESQSFEGPVYNDFELNYLQVPIIFKMYLFKGFAVEAGPSFNFLLEEYITGTSSMNPEGWIATEDLGKGFEFGAILGASYKLPGHFLVSSRFIHGLTSVFKDDTVYTESIYNYGIQLGIGYLF